MGRVPRTVDGPEGGKSLGPLRGVAPRRPTVLRQRYPQGGSVPGLGPADRQGNRGPPPVGVGLVPKEPVHGSHERAFSHRPEDEGNRMNGLVTGGGGYIAS